MHDHRLLNDTAEAGALKRAQPASAAPSEATPCPMESGDHLCDSSLSSTSKNPEKSFFGAPPSKRSFAYRPCCSNERVLNHVTLCRAPADPGATATSDKGPAQDAELSQWNPPSTEKDIRSIERMRLELKGCHEIKLVPRKPE